jgi:mRNA-degrading endonuclease RelE of RelBE toxin-antitoxin system
MRTSDPGGARLVAAALRGLSKDPRPAGVHVLSAKEGLHRLHLSRLDPTTGTTLEYRVLYQVDGEQTTVTILLVGSLPPPTRRR